MIKTAVCVIFAYLLGSIMFAYHICKVTKGVDLREVGTKNPGMANAFKCGGIMEGIFTGIGDIAKGAIPVLVAREIGVGIFGQYLVGLAALLGHMFPVYLKFKGGVGVNTAYGILLVLIPKVFLVIVPCWFLGYFLTRSNNGVQCAAFIGAFLYSLLFVKNIDLSLYIFLMGIFILMRSAVVRHPAEVAQFLEKYFKLKVKL